MAKSKVVSAGAMRQRLRKEKEKVAIDPHAEAHDVVRRAEKGTVWFEATMRIQAPRGTDREKLAEEIIARIDHFNRQGGSAEHPEIDLANAMTPEIRSEED